MKKTLTSGKIYVSRSQVVKSERGVFAKIKIKKGEVIETCPVIQIPENDLANLNESILTTYFFFFGKKKQKLLVALGFGSLYNHSHTPNAKYIIKEKTGEINFAAIKAIKKDEEITFNYSQGNPNNNKPLWFEALRST